MNDKRVVRLRNGKPTVKYLHNYLQAEFSFLKQGEEVSVSKDNRKLIVSSNTRRIVERHWKGLYE